MNLWSLEPWVRTQVTSYKQGKKGLPKCMGLLMGKNHIMTQMVYFSHKLETGLILWKWNNDLYQIFESDYYKGIVLMQYKSTRSLINADH